MGVELQINDAFLLASLQHALFFLNFRVVDSSEIQILNFGLIVVELDIFILLN